MFKPPIYLTKKGKHNALINSFVHSHDLLCSCQNPTFHCLQILSEEIGPQLKSEEKNQIKQCLGDDTTIAVGTDAGDPDMADLEKLFEDDDIEDAAG